MAPAAVMLPAAPLLATLARDCLALAALLVLALPDVRLRPFDLARLHGLDPAGFRSGRIDESPVVDHNIHVGQMCRRPAEPLAHLTPR